MIGNIWPTSDLYKKERGMHDASIAWLWEQQRIPREVGHRAHRGRGGTS